MGFVLVPVQGDDLFVNNWQWHPTVNLLQENRLVDRDKAELMHYQATFVEISNREAVAIGGFPR